MLLARLGSQSISLRPKLKADPASGSRAWLAGCSGSNGSMLLQLKGRFVLVLDGPSPARSRQLADDVWQGLDA